MATSKVEATGGCECGTVRYRVLGPAEELYHCHCSRCRRLHGALFATYAYVRREQLSIIPDLSVLSNYRSPDALWYFCGNCGCHLFAEHDHNPGVMWYMPATLDDGCTPGHPIESEKHIFVGSASSLEPIPDGAPEYDEYAPPEHSVTSRKHGTE
jgi:hypothetical protein